MLRPNNVSNHFRYRVSRHPESFDIYQKCMVFLHLYVHLERSLIWEVAKVQRPLLNRIRRLLEQLADGRQNGWLTSLQVEDHLPGHGPLF